MKFSKFSQYLQKLEETSPTLEMTEILANLFREARPNEVRRVVYLSLGELAPLYQVVRFNIAEKMMIKIISNAYAEDKERVTNLFKEKGDLGMVTEELSQKLKACPASPERSRRERGRRVKDKKPSVVGVYRQLLEIAEEGGAGSQERKIAKFSELLRSSDPLSVKFLVRISLGKLRLGFADKTVLDALSWMEAGDKSLRKPLERAYNVCPDIGLVAETFKRDGLSGLSEIRTEIGRPLLPQRCQRVKTAEEILEKMGGRTAAEPKFDGERIQLHLDRGQPSVDSRQQAALELEGFERPNFFIKTFTRNLEDVSAMFPDLLEAAAQQINAESVILDGEALGYEPETGRFLPFQVTVTRKRKYGVGEKATEVPLKLFVFDVLYKDGKSLLKMPFSERRQILEEVVGGGEVVKLTPQKIFSKARELDNFLVEKVAEGLEGLVLKNLNSGYEAGGRGFSWIKLKGEKETIDAVVLGYYPGEGKRAEFGIGRVLVGVYDEKEDVFRTVSRVGSGLTDEQFPEMKRRCDKLRVKRKPTRVDVPKELIPDVWVEPSMVVAIRADEISKSPLHSSGYALRFPRLVSFRDDKSAEEATTIKEIMRLYKLQK